MGEKVEEDMPITVDRDLNAPTVAACESVSAFLSKINKSLGKLWLINKKFRLQQFYL